MAIFIENVLDVYSIDAINDILSDKDLLLDGKTTAGRTAKKVKSNLQADPKQKQIKAVLDKIEKTLLSHTDFVSYARPLKLVKLMLSRYEVGMEYGPHIDDAFIAGGRTDLSFTLFLSDPDSYQGGELVIKRPDGDESIKFERGALYLYPTDSVHYVAPVTSGVRLAAVGWVQSRVRQQQHRDILFNLVNALKTLPDTDENRETRLNLLQAQSNLMRLWAD